MNLRNKLFSKKRTPTAKVEPDSNGSVKAITDENLTKSQHSDALLSDLENNTGQLQSLDFPTRTPSPEGDPTSPPSPSVSAQSALSRHIPSNTAIAADFDSEGLLRREVKDLEERFLLFEEESKQQKKINQQQAEELAAAKIDKNEFAGKVQAVEEENKHLRQQVQQLKEQVDGLVIAKNEKKQLAVEPVVTNTVHGSLLTLRNKKNIPSTGHIPVSIQIKEEEFKEYFIPVNYVDSTFLKKHELVYAGLLDQCNRTIFSALANGDRDHVLRNLPQKVPNQENITQLSRLGIAKYSGCTQDDIPKDVPYFEFRETKYIIESWQLVCDQLEDNSFDFFKKSEINELKDEIKDPNPTKPQTASYFTDEMRQEISDAIKKLRQDIKSNEKPTCCFFMNFYHTRENKRKKIKKQFLQELYDLYEEHAKTPIKQRHAKSTIVRALANKYKDKGLLDEVIAGTPSKTLQLMVSFGYHAPPESTLNLLTRMFFPADEDAPKTTMCRR